MLAWLKSKSLKRWKGVNLHLWQSKLHGRGLLGANTSAFCIRWLCTCGVMWMDEVVNSNGLTLRKQWFWTQISLHPGRECQRQHHECWCTFCNMADCTFGSLSLLVNKWALEYTSWLGDNVAGMNQQSFASAETVLTCFCCCLFCFSTFRVYCSELASTWWCDDVVPSVSSFCWWLLQIS